MSRRFIVMLGTDFSAPGGITAVLRSYRDGGLFARWPVVFLPTYRQKSTGGKLLVAALALLRFLGWLLSGRVAAVHAHTAARGSFWRKSVFLLLGKFAGCRTILHLHDGTFPAYYREKCGPVRQLAIRYVLARVDRVVVLTPGWLATIREIQPRACFEVIANPVSPSSIPRAPQAEEVLFLGRLWQEKGAYDLVDATALLVTEFPALCVICAGDGDAEILRARAAELGVAENLRFPGWVDGAAKDALLARASVFVLPSYFEGLPIGVLEAMINGIPVVGTPVGGVPDALGDDAGLLVTPGDVAALATALATLLRSSDLRTQMGEAGRRRAADLYACERVLASIGDLYRQLGLLPCSGSDIAADLPFEKEERRCVD